MARRKINDELIEALREIRSWKRGHVKLRARIPVDAGSGNVFVDLGFRDAKERTLKVQLAVALNRILKEREVSSRAAVRLLGIPQRLVSDLAGYRLERFTVAQLMEFLTCLGKDVEIRIAPRRSARPGSAVQVHHVS